MKVIAKAKNNPNIWHDKFTCTGAGWDQDGKIPCGCLLDVQATDIQYRNHTDISGFTDTYYGFVCCECGCFTEIPIKKIPIQVEKFAKPYRKIKD